MGKKSRVLGGNGRRFQSPEFIGAEGREGTEGRESSFLITRWKKLFSSLVEPGWRLPSPRWKEAEGCVRGGLGHPQCWFPCG